MMIVDDDSWWWSLADHVVLSCCVVLSCVDLYWIVLTCIKLVCLFACLFVCLFSCLFVYVSYLTLHFLIQYILICERPSLGVVLVPLLVFGLRVLSRQNVFLCNCIMKQGYSAVTPGSLLITTSSHDTPSLFKACWRLTSIWKVPLQKKTSTQR